MKYIITENKLNKAVIHYLNRMYGDLEEYRIPKYPDSTFFIKGKKVYMEHIGKFGTLYVDYDTIWLDLKNVFSLEYEKIRRIIIWWVKETYNLKGVFPMEITGSSFPEWKILN